MGDVEKALEELPAAKFQKWSQEKFDAHSLDLSLSVTAILLKTTSIIYINLDCLIRPRKSKFLMNNVNKGSFLRFFLS